MNEFKELKRVSVSFGQFECQNRARDYSRQSYKQYKSSWNEKVNWEFSLNPNPIEVVTWISVEGRLFNSFNFLFCWRMKE